MLALGLTRNGLRRLPAASEPMRDPATIDPLPENVSSSSAAFTLALSSGRSDSFSSNAKVVPEVILFPSKLGGFVPKSDNESALPNISCGDPLPKIPVDSELAVPEPLTIRLGVKATVLSASANFSSSIALSALLSLSALTVIGLEFDSSVLFDAAAAAAALAVGFAFCARVVAAIVAYDNATFSFPWDAATYINY